MFKIFLKNLQLLLSVVFLILHLIKVQLQELLV